MVELHEKDTAARDREHAPVGCFSDSRPLAACEVVDDHAVGVPCEPVAVLGERGDPMESDTSVSGVDPEELGSSRSAAEARSGAVSSTAPSSNPERIQDCRLMTSICMSPNARTFP